MGTKKGIADTIDELCDIPGCEPPVLLGIEHYLQIKKKRELNV